MPSFFPAQILSEPPRLLPNSNMDHCAGSRTVCTGSLMSNSSRIGQTTVMYQSGLRISELPLVVKKVRDVLKILPETEDKYVKMQNDFLQAIGDRENEETREIIAGKKLRLEYNCNFQQSFFA